MNQTQSSAIHTGLILKWFFVGLNIQDMKRKKITPEMSQINVEDFQLVQTNCFSIISNLAHKEWRGLSLSLVAVD